MSKKLNLRFSILFLGILLTVVILFALLSCDNSFFHQENIYSDPEQDYTDPPSRAWIKSATVSHSWHTKTVRYDYPSMTIIYSGYYSEVYLEEVNTSTAIYKKTISGTGYKSYSCETNTPGSWRIQVREYAKEAYISYLNRTYSGEYHLSTTYGNISSLAVPSRSPEYNPVWWLGRTDLCTTQYSRDLSNNCYSYACNKDVSCYNRDGNYYGATPGKASGKTYKELFNDEYSVYQIMYGKATALKMALRKAATNDRVYYRGDTYDKAKSTNQMLLACICDVDSLDYHWYRLDNNGYWSHKPGWNDVRNYDYKFKEIIDPKTAAWDPKYETWVGYFQVNTNCTDQNCGDANIQ